MVINSPLSPPSLEMVVCGLDLGGVILTKKRLDLNIPESKGIMQWPINLCTSPIMTHKINPSAVSNY